jgi:RNA polymerase sigma factor (sigma-70 family)
VHQNTESPREIAPPVGLAQFQEAGIEVALTSTAAPDANIMVLPAGATDWEVSMSAISHNDSTRFQTGKFAETYKDIPANPPIPMAWGCFAGEGYTGGADHTTVVVQHHLKRLAEISADEKAHPIVRELIADSANRLHLLCASMLFRSYPRLTKPPLNLRPEELLSSVVERMLKAMREVRPEGVRQFFALATQHMRWELNDLARRLDHENRAQPLNESAVAAPDQSVVTQVTRNARRILEAIEELPTDERDVFELVRIQGMAQPNAAAVLGICAKTVQRRLARALLLLSQKLCDLQPLQSDLPQKSYHSQ